MQLRYGRSVPGARQKAETWLYQKTVEAGYPPPQEIAEKRPLGQRLIETIDRILPGEPKRGGQAPQVQAEATLTREDIRNRILEQQPDIPAALLDNQTEIAYADYLRSLGQSPAPTAQPSFQVQPRSAYGSPQPGLGNIQPEKTLTDFEAEIAAEQPHLKQWPVAIKHLATQRYQDYLKGLRQ